MNFLQFEFEPHNHQEAEQLIALLANQGFDGFVEEGVTLLAFIPEANFSQADFEQTLEKFAILAYTKSSIENINWNQKWESEFEPVIVEQFAAIRAHFHPAIQSVQHEVIITPKMSFGTGHHATTYMMIRLMKDIDFTGKSVLDFGTGTGVLAILAEKLGATQLLAIDYDEWSITNAIENCGQNNCQLTVVQQADKVPANGQYDVILANINLNVLLQAMPAISAACNTGGKVLLSGFLITDEAAIVACAQKNGLAQVLVLQRNEWISIVCEKIKI
ncbi:MAG: ribosomal protein methyltransferase [Bacteroidota bacterium]|jgi:ribosomal protein L11 methyltransferase